MTIVSAESAAENVVRYGGEIGCSGTWRFLVEDGGSYEFEEVIDRGQGGACKGRGRVTVSPDGDELTYEFRVGGVESRGMLRRIGSSS